MFHDLVLIHLNLFNECNGNKEGNYKEKIIKTRVKYIIIDIIALNTLTLLVADTPCMILRQNQAAESLIQ